MSLKKFLVFAAIGFCSLVPVLVFAATDSDQSGPSGTSTSSTTVTSTTPVTLIDLGDPYVQLVAQYNTQLDATTAEYNRCTSDSCKYIALSKKNMLTASIRSAAEGSAMYPNDTSQAFGHLFAGFVTRAANIQTDLNACKSDTAGACEAIARAKMDRVHGDELLARRAFDTYAQSELARLKGGCTSDPTPLATADAGPSTTAMSTTANMKTGSSQTVGAGN